DRRGGHPRQQPGPARDARLRRRLRAPPAAPRRVRGGRRELGAPLDAPHGPLLRAPPLHAGARPRAAPERVLPRARVPDLPGRLARLPDDGAAEPAAADVGERLPAQRLDVAVVAGAAGAGGGVPDGGGARVDTARQCGGAVRSRGGLTGAGGTREAGATAQGTTTSARS